MPLSKRPSKPNVGDHRDHKHTGNISHHSPLVDLVCEDKDPVIKKVLPTQNTDRKLNENKKQENKTWESLAIVVSKETKSQIMESPREYDFTSLAKLLSPLKEADTSKETQTALSFFSSLKTSKVSKKTQETLDEKLARFLQEEEYKKPSL